MLSGEQKNTVYLSKLLKDDPQYAGNGEQLTRILDMHKVPYYFLEATKQIWCRDYMPVQVNNEKFVQFRYEPSYRKPFPEYYTDPRLVLEVNQIPAQISSIKLDGGNVVNWKDKAILTDRVLDENPEYSSRLKLVADLEKLLEVEVILIPQIKLDCLGHIDTMMRFVNQDTLIGNDRQMKGKSWKRKLDLVLNQHGLNYIDVPFFHHKNKIHPDNAIGCYVNFLEVRDLIILPFFETDQNQDQDVLDIFEHTFKDKKIIPINFNNVGFAGGLLNCASWTIAR